MNWFTYAAIGGGIAAGVFFILSQKKESKPEKPKSISSSNSSSEPVTSQVPSSSTQRPSSSTQPSSHPVQRENQHLDAEQALSDDMSAQEQAERREEKTLGDLGHIFQSINKIIERIDTELGKGNLLENLKNDKFNSKFTENNIDNAQKLLSLGYKKTAELSSNFANILEITRHGMLELKKIIDADEKLKLKFTDREYDLLDELHKSINASSMQIFSKNVNNILSSMKNLCYDYIDELRNCCIHIKEQKSEQAYEYGFGDNGWYQNFRKEYNNVLKLYQEAVVQEKAIYSIMEKIQLHFNNLSAAS